MKLTEVFDIHDQNTTFINFKIKLKKYIVSYKKNQNLVNANTRHNDFLKQNLVEIKKLFDQTKGQMKKQYPNASFVLNLTDKILNKRQLK
jgi:hypothetical protein